MQHVLLDKLLSSDIKYGRKILDLDMLQDTRNEFDRHWVGLFRIFGSMLKDPLQHICGSMLNEPIGLTSLQPHHASLCTFLFTRLPRSIDDARIILEMSLQLYKDHNLTFLGDLEKAADDVLHARMPFECMVGNLSPRGLHIVAMDLGIESSDMETTASAVRGVYAEGVENEDGAKLYLNVHHRILTEHALVLFHYFWSHIFKATTLRLATMETQLKMINAK